MTFRSKGKPATLLVALLSFSVLSAEAVADLVPPGRAKAQERLEKSSSWERVDQFCSGKTPDAACEIPGNAFEGGGSGRCVRALSDNSVDLVCRLAGDMKVDRRLPEGRYLADETLCSAVASGRLGAQVLDNQKLTCSKPALAADRFCDGKKSEDACDAVVILDGAARTYPGICRGETESTGFYYQGRRSASRDVLLCRPAKRAPEAVMMPVGLFDKFLQLFQ